MLGLSVVWLVLLCVPALAHAQFVGAEPGRGADLEQSPEQVRIRFSEPVEAEFSPIEVRGPGGERVDRDNARVSPEDARVVEADLDEDLSAGAYTVEWRVTSIDGHAVDGTYRFTVASAGAETSQGVARAEDAGNGEQGGLQDEQQSPGSTNNVLLYSAISVGALVAVVLAAVVVVQMRRRAR